MQGIITDIIHDNQYGFIKTRTIQDCLAWAFEYIYQCQHSKKEIVVLKLDFEKAFDTIEHNTILNMLKHLGFDDLWISWIRKILGSGTSAILLNNVPGNFFHCKRGVRQGDPLSPLLFVLAAELLQYIINKARTLGILSLPIPITYTEDFPIIQYADDTILFMKASQKELFCLKGILGTFCQSTGLKVNFNKSCMVPINVSAEKAEQLAGVFGCQIGQMPFTYLGLPLGTTKPRIEHYAPFMSKTERRLTSTSCMLTQADRLQLVNSVLSSLPTYMMCTLQIPAAVMEYIDRARKHCLWRGSDINAKNKPLVAWKRVSKPKDKGGLGVINLRNQNKALLLKHLDKFYNQKQVPWVRLIWTTYYSNGKIPHAVPEKGSFWWKDIMRLWDIFRDIATCSVGNGKTILFWTDHWNGHLLQDKFPRLFSFAKDKSISVAKFLANPSIGQQFHIPLTMQAHEEYLQLQDILQGIQTQSEGDNKDKWQYIWGSSIYSSKRCYNLPYKYISPP